MAEFFKGKNQKDEKPEKDKAQDISILDLLENDFEQQKDTVYRETVVLSYRITPDDMWKKSQIDALRKEIGDPFFYGVIEANIGKWFYFKPVKIKDNAYLLMDAESEEAKFKVHYQRYRLDIEIKAFGEWKMVRKNDQVINPRYIGINKKFSEKKKEQKICFIVLDVLNLPPYPRSHHDDIS